MRIVHFTRCCSSGDGGAGGGTAGFGLGFEFDCTRECWLLDFGRLH